MSEKLLVDRIEEKNIRQAVYADLGQNPIDIQDEDAYYKLSDRVVNATAYLSKSKSSPDNKVNQETIDLMRAEVASDILDDWESAGMDVSSLRIEFAKDIQSAHDSGLVDDEMAKYLLKEANNGVDVNYSNNNVSVPKTPVDELTARRQEKAKRDSKIRKIVSAGVAALALAGIGFTAYSNKDIEPLERSAAVETDANTAITNEQAKEIKKVENINKVESVKKAAKPSQEQIDKFINVAYGQKDTGNNYSHLIGNFNIDPNDANWSAENFYNELRHNPESLGFWTACLGTGTPSYEACVENPNTLNFAEGLVSQYRSMPIEQRAKNAEALIEKFKDMELVGVLNFSGNYQTISISDDGSRLYGSKNYREDDPWLIFKDKEGRVFHIRSCAQLTQGIVGESVSGSITPAPEKPAQPKKELPQQPKETEKQEDKKKDDKKNTTTTVPEEGTTTTIPEEGTTTTIPEEGTTTTEVPPPTHEPADGPPEDATIPPQQQDGTPGNPGNGEEIDGQQGKEQPGGIDSTDYGAPAPGGSPTGEGDNLVADKPSPDAPDNPDYEPGSGTSGTKEGVNDRDNPDSKTGEEDKTSNEGDMPLDPMAAMAILGLAGAHQLFTKEESLGHIARILKEKK